MSDPERDFDQISNCLKLIQDGDDSAVSQLLPMIYKDLKVMAEGIVRQQARDHTLQPTALVHEAYLRLVKPEDAKSWNNRRHFFCVAAKAMRQILIDYARGRKTKKRQGDKQRVELDEKVVAGTTSQVDLVELNDALSELERLDSRQARIVELRFLAGLTITETAEVLGVSERTVQLDWNMARSWLQQKMA